MRPLYSELATVMPNNTAHPGLIFDKYINKWRDPPNTKPDDGAKQRFYLEIVDRMANLSSVVSARLSATHKRRRELVLPRNGCLYAAKTASRLIIGLGSGHPLEAGLTWHPTLGVPYLPGSSIKGMIRAMADPKEKNGNAWGWGDLAAWEDVKHLFGDTKDLGAGSIIVFDAIPLQCSKLAVDVMTPHYGPYYREPAGNPPADWYDPKPIAFLTVDADQEFEFALVPRSSKDITADLDAAHDLLKKALECLGLGGKTAVGYGRFGRLDDVTTRIRQDIERDKLRAEQERAAAAQQENLASLSGLDRELTEFRMIWQASPNPIEQEKKATGLYQRLAAVSVEDQSRIASGLKEFFCAIGKWDTKQLTQKQKEKVQAIKQVLLE